MVRRADGEGDDGNRSDDSRITSGTMSDSTMMLAAEPVGSSPTRHPTVRVEDDSHQDIMAHLQEARVNTEDHVSAARTATSLACAPTDTHARIHIPKRVSLFRDCLSRLCRKLSDRERDPF